VFSNRLPSNLATNRLTEAIQRFRASGRPLIDLTESNPTRAGFEYPADLLTSLADPRGLTYVPSPFGLPAARAAVAGEYARQGTNVAPDRVILTASSSEAYSLLFKLLGDAGDEILVPRPSYPLFDYLTRLDLIASRPYELEYHGRWIVDVDGIERALTARTRAVLIVSPNNPTGSFVTRDELDRLAAICAPRQIALIADEVFADYELEPGAAASAGRAAAQHDALTFALGGLSKSAGLPQMKLGWIAVGGPDPHVAAALSKLEHICDTYLSVSTPAQVAAPELLRAGARLRAQIADRVRENYRQLKMETAAVPSCVALKSEGGWYSVLQVPSLEPEEYLVLRLLDAGVLVHPGYFFDFPRESYLILSLLPPSDAFRDGLMRILRHFACSASPDHHV
jgi:aspartate/methionine/tyrosine aminotransferase